jgi:hypothetical protein
MNKLWLAYGYSMAAGLLGDYWCKRGAMTNSPAFILAAAAVWASVAVTWTYIFRNHSFLTVSTLYSPLSVLLFALIGITVFKEPVTLKLGLACCFAVVSAWLASA